MVPCRYTSAIQIQQKVPILLFPVNCSFLVVLFEEGIHREVYGHRLIYTWNKRERCILCRNGHTFWWHLWLNVNQSSILQRCAPVCRVCTRWRGQRCVFLWSQRNVYRHTAHTDWCYRTHSDAQPLETHSYHREQWTPGAMSWWSLKHRKVSVFLFSLLYVHQEKFGFSDNKCVSYQSDLAKFPAC